MTWRPKGIAQCVDISIDFFNQFDVSGNAREFFQFLGERNTTARLNLRLGAVGHAGTGEEGIIFGLGRFTTT